MWNFNDVVDGIMAKWSIKLLQRPVETIYFFEATSVLQNHVMQHAEQTTGARDTLLYYKTRLMFIVHVKRTYTIHSKLRSSSHTLDAIN